MQSAVSVVHDNDDCPVCLRQFYVVFNLLMNELTSRQKNKLGQLMNESSRYS